MKKSDVITSVLASLVLAVACYLLASSSNDSEAPVPEALVPEAPVLDEIPNPYVYLVKVTARNPRESHIGSGILVEHNNIVFVLTSEMIFTESDTHYDVLLDGVTYSAGLILKDGARGLVALGVPVNHGGIEVDDAPNLPPGAGATVRSLDGDTLVTVQRYLTDPNWMILDGAIPGICTGAPIIDGDYLAGIVIGINTENAEEAFAVGNHAIREFVDEVVGN